MPIATVRGHGSARSRVRATASITRFVKGPARTVRNAGPARDGSATARASCVRRAVAAEPRDASRPRWCRGRAAPRGTKYRKNQVPEGASRERVAQLVHGHDHDEHHRGSERGHRGSWTRERDPSPTAEPHRTRNRPGPRAVPGRVCPRARTAAVSARRTLRLKRRRARNAAVAREPPRAPASTPPASFAFVNPTVTRPGADRHE